MLAVCFFGFATFRIHPVYLQLPKESQAGMTAATLFRFLYIFRAKSRLVLTNVAVQNGGHAKPSGGARS